MKNKQKLNKRIYIVCTYYYGRAATMEICELEITEYTQTQNANNHF